MRLIPFNYQTAAVAALFKYWVKKPNGHPVIALPTGTGKSLVLAEMCIDIMTRWPRTRILAITHVKELIAGNFAELLNQWPTAPAGIMSSGLNRMDIGRAITFAGIATVINCIPALGRVDVIAIDEAHLLSDKDETMYRLLIAALQEKNPHLKVVGLTATPFRMGQGMLIEPGGIFTDICFDLTGRDEFNWFLDEGFLVPLVPRRTKNELDVSEVPMVGGEFNQRALVECVDKDAITRACCGELLEKAGERDSWLVFASGVSHTVHIRDVLREMGIEAEAIHSNTKEFKMSNGERDERVAAFKGGEFRALVNNGILTTGFNMPRLDTLAIMRPTNSPSLWVQILGRGTRPLWPRGCDITTRDRRLAHIASSAKRNCLVLDFAGNTKRLGPINDPRKPKARGKGPKGDVPAKICPICDTYCHTITKVCPECGHIFPAHVHIHRGASEEALIAGREEQQTEPIWDWFTVQHVEYSSHTSWNGRRTFNGKVPNTLRVTYNTGLRSFVEHVCLEHEGPAKAAARKWWLDTAPETVPVPSNVGAALKYTHLLAKPARIRVWINRQHPQIMHREFRDGLGNIIEK